MIVENKDGSTDFIWETWTQCADEAVEYLHKLVGPIGGR